MIFKWYLKQLSNAKVNYSSNRKTTSEWDTLYFLNHADQDLKPC